MIMKNVEIFNIIAFDNYFLLFKNSTMTPLWTRLCYTEMWRKTKSDICITVLSHSTNPDFEEFRANTKMRIVFPHTNSS